MKTFYSLRELCYTALATALIAVCAQITVPALIPFTMQTFAVFFAAGLLGAKCATTAVGVYILLGIIGLPVFTGFRNGAAALPGATGGYIVGFLFIALVCGLLVDRFGRKFPILVLGMAAGMALCYFFGSAWFYLIYTQNTGAIGIGAIFAKCVLPFLPVDAIKILLAALTVQRMAKFVRKN